jgi:hypothetical protein
MGPRDGLKDAGPGCKLWQIGQRGRGVAEQSKTENRAIVCAVTADHAFALASLITGVRRHNPDFAGAFVVFHDGLADAQQAQLRALWPHMVFRAFGGDDLARRFGAGVDLGAVLARVSPMIFAKFEIPDLLADYDKCLWLDVDILVQGNLADVWAFDALAWRPLPHGAFARRAEVMEAFADMRGDGRLPLLNGGVVGMARGVPISSPDLYAMAARIVAQTSVVSVDELALYFLAAARGVPVHLLDLRFNHPVVAPEGRDAVVVHAIGPDKFWNSAPLQLAYPEWAQNLLGWTGAGFDGPQRLDDVQAATPDAALKAARNRAYWQQIYSDIRGDLPAGVQVDLASDGKALRFFYGASAPLRLIRHANERRIAVELRFDEDSSLAPAIFAEVEAADLPRMAKGISLDLARGAQGWAYTAVVPIGLCSQVLSLFVAALDQATSRAKS